MKMMLSVLAFLFLQRNPSFEISPYYLIKCIHIIGSKYDCEMTVKNYFPELGSAIGGLFGGSKDEDNKVEDSPDTPEVSLRVTFLFNLPRIMSVSNHTKQYTSCA